MTSFDAFLDEFEKISATRFQKAVDAGELSASDVGARMGPAAQIGTGKGPVAASYRHIARETAIGGSDLSPEQLMRHRRMNQGLGDAALKEVGGKAQHFTGMGPATVAGTVYAGPDSGQLIRESGQGKKLAPMARTLTAADDPTVARMAGKVVDRLGTKKEPVDSTLYRAIVHHEAGEKALMQGLQEQATGESLAIPGRMTASHLGALPILEEQHASFRDRDAQKLMHGLRGSNPDDKHIRDKIRQFGGTAENPLPIGGKAHSKLEKTLAGYAPQVPMARQQRAVQALQDVGHGTHMQKTHPRAYRALEKVTGALGGQSSPAVHKAEEFAKSVLKASGPGSSVDAADIGHRILALRNKIRR